MENADIARVLSDLADLLEIQDGNPFRGRAYRNASRTVDELTRPLRKTVAEGGDLTALPGIGKEMASHIREPLSTSHRGGDARAAQGPGVLRDWVGLPGRGAKKARLLHDELGIRELADLERAARAGEIA